MWDITFHFPPGSQCWVPPQGSQSPTRGKGWMWEVVNKGLVLQELEQRRMPESCEAEPQGHPCCKRMLPGWTQVRVRKFHSRIVSNLGGNAMKEQKLSSNVMSVSRKRTCPANWGLRGTSLLKIGLVTVEFRVGDVI